MFVCVTSWFLKHLPGDRLCGLITKGDTAFLFPLGIEPYFPGGENSVTSSEALSPSVREAPPKTAERVMGRMAPQSPSDGQG